MKRPTFKARRTRAEQHNRYVWPMSPEGWCEWFQHLDLTHGTQKGSPLHHDSRCPRCKRLPAG